MHQTIFINGRFLSQPVTGVQRYAQELLHYFDILLTEEKFHNIRLICLAPKTEFINPVWNNIEIRKVGINQGNLWEQFDLVFYAKGHLLFSPANTGPFYYSNQAITIHDASVFRMPEAYSFAFRTKYAFIIKCFSRIARLNLTDSRFSQQELSHFLGVDEERFKVVLLGGDHFRNIQADASVLQKHGLIQNGYFFTVASQSLHKNFGAIVRAAEEFDGDIQFVAAGGNFNKVFQRTEPVKIPSNLHLMGYINDNELKALYENALGFIYPSFYEGFGLPVLEAMICGCPVLCSSAASLPEVGGQAALYFDPLEINMMFEAIRRFLSDPGLRNKLQELGYEHVAKFTWENTARQTLAELVSCL